MSKTRITNKRRLAEKRGTGHGASYIPWIKSREVRGMATTAQTYDWITGRAVQCLSQAEKYFWYCLRFDAAVIDVREQFPLDPNITIELADSMGIFHPVINGEPVVMTTDFFVNYADGTKKAFSVKYNDSYKTNKRTINKLKLEEAFWELNDIPFEIVVPTVKDKIMAVNLIEVLQYYDDSFVHNAIDALKHLIARKKIVIPLDKEMIVYKDVLKDHEKEVYAWLASHPVQK
jgi:hypothetical protein